MEMGTEERDGERRRDGKGEEAEQTGRGGGWKDVAVGGKRAEG